MGWSFRKSANIGGLRLNFSKSGMGASVGAITRKVLEEAAGPDYNPRTRYRRKLVRLAIMFRTALLALNISFSRRRRRASWTVPAQISSTRFKPD
jgi:hypothetical protein